MSKYVIFTTEYNLGWYFFKHCTHSPKGFRLLNISFSCLLLVSPFNDTTEMSFIPFLRSSCLSALCYFLGIPESSPPLCVLPQLSSLSFYCSNLFFSWRPSFSFSMRALNLSYFMNTLINSTHLHSCLHSLTLHTFPPLTVPPTHCVDSVSPAPLSTSLRWWL